MKEITEDELIELYKEYCFEKDVFFGMPIDLEGFTKWLKDRFGEFKVDNGVERLIIYTDSDVDQAQQEDPNHI